MMQGLRIWTVCFYLSVMILSGQSLNSTNKTGATVAATPETETTDLPGTDALTTQSDKQVATTSLPAEGSEDDRLQTEAEEDKLMEQQIADFIQLEARRGRRGAWGKRRHAATVEATAYRLAGLGRSLPGWRGTGGQVMGTLMAVLKELHAEKRRLMDQEKAAEEEDEDDDEDDEDEDDDDEDDDDEDDEEDEDEEEEEEEEEEEQEEEEEEEVEGTESPTNQTEAYANFTESLPAECQTADGLISCRGVGMTHLPVIANLEVTKLDLAENDISHIAPEGFAGLPNLETLDLSRNKLDDESLSQNLLSNLTFLKKLHLDGNHLTRIPVLPASLEELKINSNRLDVLTPHCFKGLVNLLSLELEGNFLYEGNVSPLAFKPLEGLVTLRLDNNRFGSFPQGLPSSLQELRLSDNQIASVAAEALSGCVHLKLLNLSHNVLHEEGIAAQAWTRLTALETLDMSYNHLTSVPAPLPRPLRHLTLRHNTITHIPANTFRHLRPGLESLCLSQNALGDEGIGRFSFAGTYRTLGELLLDDNHLGEVPRSIRQFKSLQLLRLDNNEIRFVRQWGVCHPHNSASSLASLHLENNLLEVEKIPPKTFSCLTDPQGLVL